VFITLYTLRLSDFLYNKVIYLISDLIYS
jgi:hypothetical protein